MVGPSGHKDSIAARTLAATNLPRRVRRVLERSLALVTEELERNLAAALAEFEEELFRMADRAGTIGGSGVDYMQVLRAVRTNRHDLVPRFIQLLETGLAGIRTPAAPTQTTPTSSTSSVSSSLNFRNLSLVDERMMDEGAVLHEIATRQESRTNLVLHLLGQRFGVLAGAPAFDSERIPVSPQALCRAMRHAGESMQLQMEARLLFYRIFDRRVMAQYQTLAEKLDALMVEEGVLPTLTYVPMRSRGAAIGSAGAGGDDDEEGDEETQEEPQETQAAAASQQGRGGRGRAQFGVAGAAAPNAAGSRAGAAGTQNPGAQDWGGSHDMAGAQPAGIGTIVDGQRPYTSWMGQPPPGYGAAANEQVAQQDLQQLLAGRREYMERHNPIPPGQRPEVMIQTNSLLKTLSRMDAEPEGPGGMPPSLTDIKQSLLAQAKQQYGKPVALSQNDNDTFELVGMLYNHLEGEIRDDAPAAALVKRLQLTLLRVALQDRAFFVRPNHPARMLLNTVSETAAKWLADDDFDPQLLAPLQQAVTKAIKNYDGDSKVFEESNKELQQHIDGQVRRAEALERRHVEAARGKEKLEVAKQRAEEILTEIIGDHKLPKFTRALLNQAWADVLTLTLLRHGEDTEEWRKQLDATRQIIAACTHRDPNVEHPALKAHIEAALKQVGYHQDEAEVIAGRLSSSVAEETDDAESRTELTMKLKARVRLGEDSKKTTKPDLPPRTPEEQERYEQLRLLPFGTWMEFVTNQQGDVVRRRMSWFSPVTGNALFVNQRGQRIGEHSLDSLARMMAKDQVRIVTVQRAGLVDRAWQAALSALRSFTGNREEEDTVADEPAVAEPAPTSAASASASDSKRRPASGSKPTAAAKSVPANKPAAAAAEPYEGLIGDESAQSADPEMKS